MDIPRGLAVILIIFAGIIIQCKGAPNEIEPSANTSQIRSKEKNQPSKSELAIIFGNTDLETIRKILQAIPSLFPPEAAMNELLENRIVLIDPYWFKGKTQEFNQHGAIFLELGSYEKLVSFFKKFGDKVKKIKIEYNQGTDRVLRNKINKKIIKKFANKLDELRITVRHDDEIIWKELSNGRNDICFPEVKKFEYFGNNSRNKFNLNSIFPKLESVKLIGMIKDENCLAGITRLKVLELYTRSIKESKLVSIFANNKKITKLSLREPRTASIMEAIAKTLTKLETLSVRYPDINFMFRSDSQELYRLPSVKYFNIVFSEEDDLVGDLSFHMQHLKRLRLEVKQYRFAAERNQIINFIEKFRTLESVTLIIGIIDHKEFYIPEFIKEIKSVKELTVENLDITSLRKVFQDFDENSNLQILKLLCPGGLKLGFHEKAMKRINDHLENLNKPTWTLSHGERIDTGEEYLMFERQQYA